MESTGGESNNILDDTLKEEKHLIGELTQLSSWEDRVAQVMMPDITAELAGLQVNQSALDIEVTALV